MNISQTLISWYHSNKRDLPWRSTRDPYKIWLSEVILQQTRVNQGMDYYFRFLNQFPDVYALASASEQEVLKLWQGLGYYSRARNLHFAAKSIVVDLNGEFPDNFNGLLKIKGIGNYTAAAIASISFNEVIPVVDGNVARVLSRLYALEEPVDSTKGKKILFQIAEELIPSYDPATFNQAIMEFGALQCKPGKPDCSVCPLQLHCEAYINHSVLNYPVKRKQTQVQEVFYYYMVVTFVKERKHCILLRHRKNNGIWKNLYDFPLFEASSLIEIPLFLESEFVRQFRGNALNRKTKVSEEFHHQLTHRKINARFFQFFTDKLPEDHCDYVTVPITELIKFPVPRLIETYLIKEGFLKNNDRQLE